MILLQLLFAVFDFFSVKVVVEGLLHCAQLCVIFVCGCVCPLMLTVKSCQFSFGFNKKHNKVFSCQNRAHWKGKMGCLPYFWLSMQDLTLQEAETIALSILKQVMEEKVKLLMILLQVMPYFLLHFSKTCNQLGLYDVRWPLIMLTLQRLHQPTISTPQLRLRLSLPAYEKGATSSSFLVVLQFFSACISHVMMLLD